MTRHLTGRDPCPACNATLEARRHHFAYCENCWFDDFGFPHYCPKKEPRPGLAEAGRKEVGGPATAKFTPKKKGRFARPHSDNRPRS